MFPLPSWFRKLRTIDVDNGNGYFDDFWRHDAAKCTGKVSNKLRVLNFLSI